ncbi:MAG: lysine-2,3-aminomutase-like protein [Azospirillaceae bacterium]
MSVLAARPRPVGPRTPEEPGPKAAPLRDFESLLAAGLVAESDRAALESVIARYATAIPPTLAAAIDPNDPDDPIAAQVVPHAGERDVTAEERADPIGDATRSPVPGLVHRYPDRVLLKPVHVCPVYCRFCFRREVVGPGGDALSPAELADALDYIRARPAIGEVILTGGDPLMLSPRRLGELMAALAAIEHVAVIRIHSRVPVADPGRLDDALADALDIEASGGGAAVWLSVHANHARELGDEAAAALRRARRRGVGLIGQTVLLAGVNDDPATLEALFRRMVALGVKPYYLHHPDLAPGTARFRMPIERGRAIVGALRGRLSGLAIPTYVLDLPGGHGKVNLGPSPVEGAEAGGWTVEDWSGRRHAYPPPAGDPI